MTNHCVTTWTPCRSGNHLRYFMTVYDQVFFLNFYQFTVTISLEKWHNVTMVTAPSQVDHRCSMYLRWWRFVLKFRWMPRDHGNHPLLRESQVSFIFLKPWFHGNRPWWFIAPWQLSLIVINRPGSIFWTKWSTCYVATVPVSNVTRGSSQINEFPST